MEIHKVVVKIDGMVVQTQWVVVVGLSYYFEQGVGLGWGMLLKGG